MLFASQPGLKVHCGDARECLADIDPGSVQTIVTSPPYFNLRDYGTASWEGGSPDCAHGVGPQTSRLKSTSSTLQGSHVQEAAGARYRVVCGLCGATRVDSQIGIEADADAYLGALVEVFRGCREVLAADGTLWLNLGDSYGAPKPKDLNGISWRAALALQSDGWWLRSCVIWDKNNAQPESASDRPSESHEYLFLLSPAERYMFRHPRDTQTRSVWRGPTAGYRGEHIAVMPLWLAQNCLLHTSRPGDLVLDPFAGSGTTLVAACSYGRTGVGIDLSFDNCTQIVRRVRREAWKLPDQEPVPEAVS